MTRKADGKPIIQKFLIPFNKKPNHANVVITEELKSRRKKSFKEESVLI